MFTELVPSLMVTVAVAPPEFGTLMVNVGEPVIEPLELVVVNPDPPVMLNPEPVTVAVRLALAAKPFPVTVSTVDLFFFGVVSEIVAVGVTVKFVAEVAEFAPPVTTTARAPAGTAGIVNVTVLAPFVSAVPPPVTVAETPPTVTVSDCPEPKP